METLSIIAYKQPITKLEIEKIRGVKSDHAVNRLIEYNLVYEVGRLDAPGRPALFATTEEFLRRFGVGSTEQLPEINPGRVDEFRLEVEEELKIEAYCRKILPGRRMELWRLRPPVKIWIKKDERSRRYARQAAHSFFA